MERTDGNGRKRDSLSVGDIQLDSSWKTIKAVNESSTVYKYQRQTSHNRRQPYESTAQIEQHF